MKKWKRLFKPFERYFVSNKGDIFDFKRRRYVGLHFDKNGYMVVGLYNSLDKKFKLKKVHSLVMLMFKGVCPNGYEINHKDTNKKNNNFSNLEYVTHLENMRHAKENKLIKSRKGRDHHFYGKRHSLKMKKKIGDSLRGKFCRESNFNSKLTNKQIFQIKSLYLERKNTQKEIGLMFNVARTTIGRIVRNETWKPIKIVSGKSWRSL